MSFIGQFMNNREVVALIYVALLLVLALAIKDARSSLLQVLKILFLSRLGLTFAFYMAVIAAAIWLMSMFGFWTQNLLGSTLLWVLVAGFVWFIHVTDAGKDPDFFKRRVLEALGVGAFFEFFVNLETLPLLGEFVLQGFIILVALLNAAASTEARLRPVARLTSGLLISIGLALLLYTIVRLIQNLESVNIRDVLNQLLLPVWLTLAAIPALYLIALFAGYGSLFQHLRFWNDKRRPKLRAHVGTVLALRGSLVDINEFRGPKTQGAAEASSIRTALNAVGEFRRDRDADRTARAAAHQRLIDNAGVTGVDNAGLQLDRREFTETKRALRWIASCHMGWYQRDDRPDRYRMDLMDMLGDLTGEGLPDDHGVVMRVRRDGQAWYAYRTTASGYVLAIGASGPPPSQWFWDGPKPPNGYPSKKSGWTSFTEPDRPEWREEAAT